MYNCRPSSSQIRICSMPFPWTTSVLAAGTGNSAFYSFTCTDITSLGAMLYFN